MARSSVEVLVDIALRLAEVSKALLINITSFYKSEEPHLVNEAMIGFYRVLRKYPSLFADIKPSLVVRRHLINEQDSQRAFLWLLGTFAQHLEDSPYILE